MNARHRIRFAAAAAVALAGAACSKGGQPMDDGLKQDLAAAKTAASSHLSISPLELGERSAPAPKHVAPRPAKQPALVAPKRDVAQIPQVEQAPAPVVQAQTPAPQPAEQPAPAAAKPAPVPARGNGDEQHGRYKSEAEIFRQMPWIKP